MTAQPLPGTAGASYPFWSPDGRAIGFFADGKLKKIDLGSAGPQELGYPRPVAAVARGTATTSWYLPSDVNRGVYNARGGGGWDASGRDAATYQAWGAIAGRSFCPMGTTSYFSPDANYRISRACSWARWMAGQPTHVLAAETAAVYAPPGVLLWVHQGVLVAQRFDPARKVVSGEPIPVAHDGRMWTMACCVARLRCRRPACSRIGPARGERRQLTWVDRAGIARGTVGPPDEDGLSSPELAPDGQRVAVQRTVQGNPDVWLMETGRDVPSRFTFDASNEGLPLWSPDGAPRGVCGPCVTAPSTCLRRRRVALATSSHCC